MDFNVPAADRDGIWEGLMKKISWITLSAGILVMVPLTCALASNGGFGNDGYGMAFGLDGRPEKSGFEFFAACLALCLVFFLLPVWLLKRHHRPRLVAGGMIPFLPFSASFHLADSGETIGHGKSVPQGDRDGELTFRPFSFP